MQCPKVMPRVWQAVLSGARRPQRHWEGPGRVALRWRGPWFLPRDTSSGGPDTSPGVSAVTRGLRRSLRTCRKPPEWNSRDLASRPLGAQPLTFLQPGIVRGSQFPISCDPQSRDLAPG